MMRLTAALALLAVLVMPSVSCRGAYGQDAKLEVRGADTVRSVLERLQGRRVGVVLTTGPELAGVVERVADNLVHLSALTGREFSDAVVSLDQIGAVIVKVR
jgi:hypothetical protein